MAKLKMQKLRIAALRKDRKAVLERLQRLGAVEPNSAASDEVLQHPDTSQQQAQLEDAIKSIELSLGVLEQYVPEKKPFLSGYRPRRIITGEDYEQVRERSKEILGICSNIAKWHKQIGENEAENIRAQTRIDQLEPWLGLDIPLGFKGTAATKTLIGTMPPLQDSSELLAALAAECPEVDALDVELVGSTNEASCVVVMCMRSQRTEVENALRGMGFARLTDRDKKTPDEICAQLREETAARNEESERLKEKIAESADSRRDMQNLLDSWTMRLEKYQAIEQLSGGENVFILEGWCLAKEYDRVAAEMEKLGAYCEKAEPQKGDTEPVALKNNAFTEGGAPILEMFSLPSKSDVDPTGLMAFFYYILFGVMLGDAAYGLLIAIATGAVLLFLRPEAPQRKMMKLFCFSGISAIFWGVLFGSYFGDLPNTIAKTFFGATENVINPVWFDPIGEPMTMFVVSLVIGGIHVLTGLVVGVVASLKNKDVGAAIFDYLAWLTLIISIIGWALLSMVELPFAVPPVLSKVFLGILIASVAAILLMNGRSSKNFIVRIMKGAYALYGITSYLSDFMSYSRVLALGLATGVISQVFNRMATMVGGSGNPVAIVLMIIVLIVGHVFNIGISLIGCYVHTCRLQYVEFFGKFYEGGGKAFSPLAANTKYFKFKEEN